MNHTVNNNMIKIIIEKYCVVTIEILLCMCNALLNTQVHGSRQCK